MRLNKFHYAMLRVIMQAEKTTSRDLAKNLNVSLFRISKNLRLLKEQNLISKSGRFVTLGDTGLASTLARFLLEHPNVETVFRDTGFTILQLFETSKSLQEVVRKTGISGRTGYRYVQLFLNRGMLIRQNGHYALNDKLWPDLRELILSAKAQSGLWKLGIPSSAKIYLQVPERIIFSTDLPVEASVTAFSRYANFGISILQSEKIYRLPQKKLTLHDIFLDSLECLTDARRKIIATLFYLKHYEKLKFVVHPELENIRKILKGEKLSGYPALDEIKERAELYDIKI